MMNLADSVFAETAALQPNSVDPVSVRVARGHSFRKWQHIFGDGCATSNKCMCPNADEMMYRTQCAYLGPVFHTDMSAERGSVGQDYVIANAAIMRDVGVGHDQHMTTDFG